MWYDSKSGLCLQVNFFIFYNMVIEDNKKRTDKKKPPVQIPPLSCIHYTFKACSTCAEIKIPKHCSKKLYCRWCSYRHEKNPWFSEMGRNCEQRFTLFCYIIINSCLLWIREEKEENSRWSWIPLSIILNKPSLLSDVLRVGFNCWGFFGKIPNSFLILSWPLKKQILSMWRCPLQLPYHDVFHTCKWKIERMRIKK